MKNLVITSIVALSIAAPAVAQSQLERSVGAEAGQYTLNELVLLKAAAESDGNERHVYLGNETIDFASRNLHSPAAVAIFEELAAEQDGNF